MTEGAGVTQRPYGSDEPPWGPPNDTAGGWGPPGPPPGPGDRRTESWAGPTGHPAPPLTGHPATGPYPVAGYPAPGYPPAIGYPTPSGYPMAPGYPGWGLLAPRRPGVTTSAGVLAIVHGSWVLLEGMLLLVGASWIVGATDYSGRPAHDEATEFMVVAVATLVVGALCLTGGIQVLSGRRGLLFWGCGLSLALSAYWLIRSDFVPGFLWFPVTHAAMPVVAIALALSAETAAWCAARSARLAEPGF